MTIRKTGAATGQVTEVEQPQEGITATAAMPGQEPLWAPEDEAALLGENEAADQG